MKNAILLLLTSLSFAQCKVTFSVVVKDNLNNVRQGFGPKTFEWFQKKMTRKYPDVCYSTGTPPVVLFFSAKPDTYHGIRHYSTSETHNNPVNGTVTDTTPGSPTYGQQVGEVSGNVQTTTTTEHADPYEVDYDRLYLSVELAQPDQSWKVMHNFSGKTLHPTMYGICTHNCHPAYKMVEEAVKWLHDGGLNDSTQTVLP